MVVGISFMEMGTRFSTPTLAISFLSLPYISVELDDSRASLFQAGISFILIASRPIADTPSSKTKRSPRKRKSLPDFSLFLRLVLLAKMLTLPLCWISRHYTTTVNLINILFGMQSWLYLPIVEVYIKLFPALSGLNLFLAPAAYNEVQLRFSTICFPVGDNLVQAA